MFAHSRSRRIAFTVISAIACALATYAPAARAQDDDLPENPKRADDVNPGKQGIDHQQMMENIAKQPLTEEAFVKDDGKPLTDAERKEIDRSATLLTSAADARAEGKYKDAAKSVDEAVGILRNLLGTKNHRTTAAMVEQRLLAKIVASSDTEQARIAKADKALAEAKTTHEQGDYPNAQKLAAEAVRAYEVQLGKDSPALVPALISLARSEIELKHLDVAETALARALPIAESVYGKNHPQVARVLDRQGWLLINQGKYREGVQTMTRAVRIFRSNMGETSELAEVLDNLGTALALVPDFSRALASKLRAYVIREKVLGADAKDTAVSLSNLAWLYGRGTEAQQKEAIPLRKRAMAIFKRVLGPDHPYTLLEMANLAAAYRSEDLDDDALELYKELIARDEAQPDPVSDRMVERRIILGNFLLRKINVDEGMRHLAIAADLAAKLREQGDPKNAYEQMQILATTYYNQRKFAEAITAIETVRKWADEDREPKNDFTVGRLRRLGAIMLEMGRVDEGIKHLDQAAKDSQEVFGKGDLRTGTPLLKLAEGYEQAGQLDKAEDACNEALRIAEEKLPPGSRSYAYCLRVMGRIYTAQKQYDLAKFSFEEAKKILEDPRVRNIDPLALAGTLQDLAQCQTAMGKTDEGVQLCRDALAICEEIAGDLISVNMTNEVAKAKYRLFQSLKDKADSAKERDQLRADIKTLIGKLKESKSLSAENEAWLAEVG